jgi:hypothetical protein
MKYFESKARRFHPEYTMEHKHHYSLQNRKEKQDIYICLIKIDVELLLLYRKMLMLLLMMNSILIVHNHYNVMLIFHFDNVLREHFFSYLMLLVLYTHLYVIMNQLFEYDSNLVHVQLQVNMLLNVLHHVH